MFYAILVGWLSVYFRFVFRRYGESDYRVLNCRMQYRHWQGWEAFSGNGISILTGCLYFKEVDYISRLCWWYLFVLLSPEFQETLIWYIMAKKVFALKIIVPPRQWGDVLCIQFDLLQELTVLVPKATVRGKALKAQGVFSLLTSSLEQNQQLLGWRCFMPSEELEGRLCQFAGFFFVCSGLVFCCHCKRVLTTQGVNWFSTAVFKKQLFCEKG